MELFFDNLIDPEHQFAEELEDSVECSFKLHNNDIIIQQTTVSGSIGSSIWPASNLFLDYLNKLPKDYFTDKKVLELGSGVGILSISVSLMGAAEVIATDIPYITKWTMHNVQLNQAERVRVCPLIWGDNATASSLVEGSLDYLIAADVVYSPESVPDLLSTVHLLIKNTNCKVIFALKWRANDTNECFWSHIEHFGLSVDEIDSQNDGSISLLSINVKEV
ncbi:hypothetical protein P9112_006658 [Eukaryota sp. TZLM1-RC]